MKLYSPAKAMMALGALACLLAAGADSLRAQERLSDKDVESLMKNLQDDAGKFRSAYDSAVSKSIIRKTSKEKESKELVKRFEKQVEGMRKQFKDKKKAAGAVEVVVYSAKQLDAYVQEVNDIKTTTEWNKVSAELKQVAEAFNVKM